MIIVTAEEVETAVEILKTSNVAGPGNIPAELLKNAHQKLCKMIAQLFAICINKHTIPKEGKIPHITPYSDTVTGKTAITIEPSQ